MAWAQSLSRVAGVAAIAATLVLSACGGDDGDSESSAAADHAVDFTAVQTKLDNGMTPEQVFRRLDATPLTEYEKPGLPKGDKPGVLHVCYRFEIEGGRPTDIAELCFRRNKSLGAIGATRSTAGGGVAPIP